MTLPELLEALLKVDQTHEGLRCAHFLLDRTTLDSMHALELAQPGGKRALFMCCSACKRDTESRLRIVPLGNA